MTSEKVENGIANNLTNGIEKPHKKLKKSKRQKNIKWLQYIFKMPTIIYRLNSNNMLGSLECSRYIR